MNVVVAFPVTWFTFSYLSLVFFLSSQLQEIQEKDRTTRLIFGGICLFIVIYTLVAFFVGMPVDEYKKMVKICSCTKRYKEDYFYEQSTFSLVYPFVAVIFSVVLYPHYTIHYASVGLVYYLNIFCFLFGLTCFLRLMYDLLICMYISISSCVYSVLKFKEDVTLERLSEVIVKTN
jgi:hypothetical protein